MRLHPNSGAGEVVSYQKGEGPDVRPSGPSLQQCPTWTAELVGLIKRKGSVMKETIRRTDRLQ